MSKILIVDDDMELRGNLSDVLQDAGYTTVEALNGQAALNILDSEDFALVLLDMVRRVIRFTVAKEQDIEAICLQCGGKCGESCVIEHCQGHCVRADDNPILDQPAGAEQKGSGSGPGPDLQN